MGAPTVVTHGSDVQKKRYLRPLFTGEEIWCQLFSEPGAGQRRRRSLDRGRSATATSGWSTVRRCGPRSRTSRAFGMLIARTNPDAPKHKGMTYFVVDMKAPGVEVRPLVQITGEAEFNEVYFTDVRIPDAERLSDVGEGWGVSITTLMNERVSIGGTVAPRGSGLIATAVHAWNADRPYAIRSRATASRSSGARPRRCGSPTSADRRTASAAPRGRRVRSRS